MTRSFLLLQYSWKAFWIAKSKNRPIPLFCPVLNYITCQILIKAMYELLWVELILCLCWLEKHFAFCTGWIPAYIKAIVTILLSHQWATQTLALRLKTTSYEPWGSFFTISFLFRRTSSRFRHSVSVTAIHWYAWSRQNKSWHHAHPYLHDK